MMNILVMLSGGLDSIAALTAALEVKPDAHYLILHSQRRQADSPRWMSELYCALEAIAYFKGKGYRIEAVFPHSFFPVENSMGYCLNSNSDAICLCAKTRFQRVIVGSMRDDFVGQGEPTEFHDAPHIKSITRYTFDRIKRIFLDLGFMSDITLWRPVYNLSKSQCFQLLPAELKSTFSSCQFPVERGGQVSGCGGCPSCRELADAGLTHPVLEVFGNPLVADAWRGYQMEMALHERLREA